MKVSVKTETETETVCDKRKYEFKKGSNKRFLWIGNVLCFGIKISYFKHVFFAFTPPQKLRTVL